MNNTRLLEIARAIAGLLEEQANCIGLMDDSKRKIEARKLELTPDAGWEGKNAESRELMAIKTFAADETIRKLQALLVEVTDKMNQANWRIEALRDERRALEWGIKADLVNVLAHRQIPADNGAEFDAVAEQAVEQQAWASIPVADNGPVWDTEEAPF
jgi:hypothetical protein